MTVDGSATGAVRLLGEDAMAVLRRISRPRAQTEDVERCEMCAEPIASEHGHVASLSEHRLLCACRGCYLLFTQEGAGARRLRAVPDRHLSLAGFTLTESQWELLSIPVNLVFFFGQTESEGGAVRTVACYPSPAGATESLLDLELWQSILDANSELATAEPDVEALLLRRHQDGRIECYLVPIDACYHLVGIVRQYWVGFAGGAEVWREIDGFFERIAARVRPVRA
jgi:hypothetical protein